MTPDLPPVTDEMRRAVARDDCQRQGHEFKVGQNYGSPAPSYVICTRCGRNWDVKGEAFGG